MRPWISTQYIPSQFRPLTEIPLPVIPIESVYKEANMSSEELKSAIEGIGMAFLNKDLTLKEYLRLLYAAKTIVVEKED